MQTQVQSREIRHIYHFTRIDNLNSILTHGIVPRSLIPNQGMEATFNDSFRLDGQLGASCFSIGHPNYKLFYALRQQNPAVEWVVIGCHASILWTRNCAFCHENAASSAVTSIPIAERMSVEAFNAMYDPVAGKPSREQLGIPAQCPTNPQAEVLVFGIVPPSLIVGVICQSAATRDRLAAVYPNTHFVYHRAAFSPRGDFEHWRVNGQ